jgi:hypothetical protein
MPTEQVGPFLRAEQFQHVGIRRLLRGAVGTMQADDVVQLISFAPLRSEHSQLTLSGHFTQTPFRRVNK